MVGEINGVINRYLNDMPKQNTCIYHVQEVKDVCCVSAKIFDRNSTLTDTFRCNEDLYLQLELFNRLGRSVQCSIGLLDKSGTLIMIQRFELIASLKLQTVHYCLSMSQFVPDTYVISIALYVPNYKVYDLQKECLSFSIIDTKGLSITQNGDTENGIMLSSWKQIRV